MANKYLENISKSKDEKEKAELTRVAKRAARQVDVDIDAAEVALEDAQAELEAAVSSLNFDASNVLEIKRTIAETQADLDALKEIKAEYFTEA